MRTPIGADTLSGMGDDDLRRLERALRRTGSVEDRQAYERARRRSRADEPLLDELLELAEGRGRALPRRARSVLLSQLAWAQARRGAASEAERLVQLALAGEGLPPPETASDAVDVACALLRLGGARVLAGGDGWPMLRWPLDALGEVIAGAQTAVGALIDTLGHLAEAGHAEAALATRARALFSAMPPHDQVELAASCAAPLRRLYPLETLRALAGPWLSVEGLTEQRRASVHRSPSALFRFVGHAARALTAFHDGALQPELVRACWDAVADAPAREALDLASHEDDREHARSLAEVEAVWNDLLGALGDDAAQRADALRSVLLREDKPIEAAAAGFALTSCLVAGGDLDAARATLLRTWEDVRRLEVSTPLATCARRVCALADAVGLAPDPLSRLVSQLQEVERTLAAGEELPSIRAASIALVVRLGDRPLVDAELEVSAAALLTDPPPTSTQHVSFLASLVRALGRAAWPDDQDRVDRCATTASAYLTAVGQQPWPRVIASHAAAEALTTLFESDRRDEALTTLATFDPALQAETVELLAQDLERWPRPFRLELLRALFTSSSEDSLAAAPDGRGRWLRLFTGGVAQALEPLT